MSKTAHVKRSGLKRMVQAVGSAPGSLSIDPDWPKPSLRVMAYGPEDYREDEIRADQIPQYRDSWPMVWINVDGLGDESVLRQLAEIFNLHRLALEDVVNLGQRAKVEGYDEDLFIVVRSPGGSAGAPEQVTLLVGPGFVVSFQEHRGDSFDGVRERIRHGKGRIRKTGSDYLAYALIDAVIDSYFPVLEDIAESLESLEQEVLASPDQQTVSQIYEVKRRLLGLRRTISPHREALNALIRDAGGQISEETGLYFRDTYDHCVRIIELVESQRDLCSDLMATYLSVVSNRMNEVMKVLSIIGTVFIPLGFIAGLYGMNFDPAVSRWNMPELGWYWGYPAVLLLMAGVAIALLVVFRRRRWI
jgi:magnesium transporter